MHNDRSEERNGRAILILEVLVLFVGFRGLFLVAFIFLQGDLLGPGQGDLRRSGKGIPKHHHARDQDEALLPRERVLRVTEEHAEEGVAILENDKPVAQPRF